MPAEARFLLKAQTQSRLPDSRFPPNADSARPCHGCHDSLSYISCCQSFHNQNLISFFPASQERRFVLPSVTDIGYFLRADNIIIQFFRCRREMLAGGCRKCHKQELHKLVYLPKWPNITVVRMKHNKCIYNFSRNTSRYKTTCQT